MEVPVMAIEAEARLRAKNQITVPEAIVSALEAQPNDTLIFEADVADPGVIRVRLLPRSFAGALTGTFGTSEDVKAFLDDEHEAWG
jgi:bifunctional DNA-binding transcriptional regulator/antitoxin component of YhaV-PrlF toxin-antitoxin module